MQIIDTNLRDVKIIQPRVFSDERGFFMETFRDDWFKENVADYTFVQDNHAGSVKNVLRGLHYQIERPQGKLVRVIFGEVFDVAVDIRRGSPDFGKWTGLALSAGNRKMLWVPPGFAHGYYVMSETAEFVYRCTDYYAPQHERSILWSDPAVGVAWGVPEGTQPILSDRDRDAVCLEDAAVFR